VIPVARTIDDPRELLDVDMNQLARRAPLVSVGRLEAAQGD